MKKIPPAEFISNKQMERFMDEHKKRILIDVPNIIRDGINLCYLKILLEERGHKVKLVDSAKDTIFTILSFRPHAVILSSVSEVRVASIAKYVKALGGKVIILPTEGGYPKNMRDRENMFPTKFTKNYNATTDLWLSWSSGYAEALQKFVGISSNKIKVCGCSRFDVYRPPLNRVLMTKDEFCELHDIDPSRKIVTMPTNFVSADTNLEHAKGSIFHAEDFEWIKRKNKTETKRRLKAVSIFSRLALPGVSFVLKVHPWEDGEFYLEHTWDTTIRVIKKEPISDIINVSDVWIHTSCSTAKEAGLMGKPVVALPDFDVFDDILREVQRCLKGKRPKSVKLGFKADGKSTKRCADEISKFLKETDINPHFRFPFEHLGNVFSFDTRSIIRRLIYSNRLTRNAYLKLRWGKSDDYLRFVNKEMYDESFDERIERIEKKIRL